MKLVLNTLHTQYFTLIIKLFLFLNFIFSPPESLLFVHHDLYLMDKLFFFLMRWELETEMSLSKMEKNERKQTQFLVFHSYIHTHDTHTHTTIYTY